jgi:hypothetical protein
MNPKSTTNGRGRVGRPPSPKILRTCQYCGATFYVSQGYLNRGGGLFCNRACSNASRLPTDPPRMCAWCHKPFQASKASQVRRYCSTACNYAAKRDTFSIRFWARVQKTDDCWLWTGSTKHGYGQVNWNGRKFIAHRAAYILTYGAIPDGLFVCHTCDVPACVRPDHLFLGTHADNMQDKVAKGRQVRGDDQWLRRYPQRRTYGDANPSRKHPERHIRGENHANAKLTEQDVRDIRAQYASGSVTYKHLAKQMGVSETLIRLIVVGKRWQHIT